MWQSAGMTSEENPVPESDSALRVLAYLVETSQDDFSVNVALNIAGSIVTGEVVPSTVWMRRFGIYDAMADARDREIEAHRAALGSGQVTGPGALLPNFIHLQDVVNLSGAGSVGGNAVWRYAIADVAGWTIGGVES